MKSTKFFRALSQPGYRPQRFPKLENSYYHNSPETGSQLTNITIDQALNRTVEKYGQNIALLCHHQNDYQLNFEEFEQKVNKLADSFIQLGLPPKSRITIWSPNIKEYYIIQLAVSKAGMILVPLNPNYTSQEAEYTLDFAEVDCVISPRGIRDTQDYCREINKMSKKPKYQILINDSQILHENYQFETPKDPTIDFDDFLNSGTYNSSHVLNVNNQSDDISMILFTSGTTGTPKAATLTHFSVINGATQTNLRQGKIRNEIVCLNVPLFHALGNVCGSVVTAITGNTLLLPYFTWSPKNTIKTIQNCQATYMYGTPTMYIDLINQVNQMPELDPKQTFKSLKTGLVAASVMPKEIFELSNQLFDIQTQNFYGSTENSTVMTGCYLDDPIEKQLNTVGRAFDHIELKVVDSQGETVPIGHPGELCTRGWPLMKGYLKDPERTAQAIDENRWYHTGDLAEMDEEGYIKIVGRIKDMLIRGGENVYPIEIESCLLQHEYILDAQVVAAKDSRLIEVPAVYIRLQPNVSVDEEQVLADLKQHCAQSLAKFKIPQYWKILDVYPTTLSGKVKKYELRARTETDFDLQ